MRALAIVYLLLVAAALGLPFIAGGPEAGIYAVILTLPWSFVFSAFLDAFDPGLSDSGIVVLLLGSGAVLNVFIVRLITARFRGKRPAGGE